MEVNTKKELLSIIEDLQYRLAVVEDAGKKPEPKNKEEDKPKEPETDNSSKVESEDEIEKLLNC